jgi:hypothetical protein
MLQSETKTCQNCKNKFTVESDDFEFYNKIKVPPPTFCPGCRLQRRLAFLNFVNLYRRSCDLCKKDTISRYDKDAPYIVYCAKCWWSDDWDPLSYGRDYDFSKPFFGQLKELWSEVPLLGLSNDELFSKNSPYNNHSSHLKNCYLLFHADYVEDSSYGLVLLNSKSVIDCSLTGESELCYDSINAWKDYKCIGVDHTNESMECAFLKDSINCQNCFASANLRNKKYYIFNKPYSKEDYFEETSKWDLGSYKTYQEIKNLVKEHWKKFPPKPRWDEFTTNVSGNYVFDSKNCKECFEVIGAEDSKYLLLVSNPPIKDCYDISSWGNNISLSCECSNVGENASDIKFSEESGLNLYRTEYCKLSAGGHDHFGCVSVKKGEYCILNKQYKKEEYEELKEKIIKHMNDVPYVDKKGRVYKYGEFFPVEMSPFAYNETVAFRFSPLQKEQAVSKGFEWRDEEEKEYAITKKAEDIPDHIKDVPDDILKEIIGCGKCGKGYKIIKMELDFL